MKERGTPTVTGWYTGPNWCFIHWFEDGNPLCFTGQVDLKQFPIEVDWTIWKPRCPVCTESLGPKGAIEELAR